MQTITDIILQHSKSTLPASLIKEVGFYSGLFGFNESVNYTNELLQIHTELPGGFSAKNRSSSVNDYKGF